jgi:hypothetical protein
MRIQQVLELKIQRVKWLLDKFRALFLLLIPVFCSLAKNNFSRYVSMGNSCYALFAYGNGGDLSFMLIIGIAYTEFVMISLFPVKYTNSKAGEKI